MTLGEALAQYAKDKDLRWANLCGANLRATDLHWADLREANLCGANLRWADLRWANLNGANLRATDLHWADLREANLCGTCLDPDATPSPIDDHSITSAGMTIEGDYVYGWRTAVSQHYGNTVYEPGQHYVASYFSIDTETSCHPGIYLGDKEWLQQQYPGVALVPCKCLRSELVHAGDKWRAKQIWVLETERTCKWTLLQWK